MNLQHTAANVTLSGLIKLASIQDPEGANLMRARNREIADKIRGPHAQIEPALSPALS